MISLLVVYWHHKLHCVHKLDLLSSTGYLYWTLKYKSWIQILTSETLQLNIVLLLNDVKLSTIFKSYYEINAMPLPPIQKSANSMVVRISQSAALILL